MKIEQMIEVMQAHARGEVIESSLSGEDKFAVIIQPAWDWCAFDYRVAGKKRPLDPCDIPLGAWVRQKDWPVENCWLVVERDEEGVWRCPSSADVKDQFSYHDLMNGWLYSVDQGQTWNPCWK